MGEKGESRILPAGVQALILFIKSTVHKRWTIMTLRILPLGITPKRTESRDLYILVLVHSVHGSTILYLKSGNRDFPGSPVVGTAHFQCSKRRVLSLVRELRSHAVGSGKKKKKKLETTQMSINR